tara:strand:- start:314 stop:424 length:111 start_codon:yes stop_codon:yes gene_type:complete
MREEDNTMMYGCLFPLALAAVLFIICIIKTLIKISI